MELPQLQESAGNTLIGHAWMGTTGIICLSTWEQKLEEIVGVLAPLNLKTQWWYSQWL